MFTLIWRRNPHDSENHYSTYAENHFYRFSTEEEVIDMVKKRVTAQVTEECENPAREYGEYGFVLLYNGFMIFGSDTYDSNDGYTDYTFDDHPDIEGLPYIDVHSITRETKNRVMGRRKAIDGFNNFERNYKAAAEKEFERLANIKREKAKLVELLKKYPEMANG